MRKTAMLAGICAVLLGASAAADVDLKDFDDDLMKTLGETIKLLEPDINAKNLDAANQEVGVFTDGFKWVEDYFAAKGNAADAVKFAHDSRDLTDAVQKALAAKNFDAAAAAARTLSKSCKSCHDVYKPL
jgi:cytochrome c556